MKVRRPLATAWAVAALTCAVAVPTQAEPPAGAETPARDTAAGLFAHLAANETPATGEDTNSEAAAKEPEIVREGTVERVPMFSTPGLGSRSSSGSAAAPSEVSTADQIRQARAQFRARQRMARIEARKWQGYEPLRPTWNAVPMMTSRYTARRVVRVPVYVPAR